MPEYKEDDLKLFLIKLCAKDQFGSGLSGKSKWVMEKMIISKVYCFKWQNLK